MGGCWSRDKQPKYARLRNANDGADADADASSEGEGGPSHTTRMRKPSAEAPPPYKKYERGRHHGEQGEGMAHVARGSGGGTSFGVAPCAVEPPVRDRDVELYVNRPCRRGSHHDHGHGHGKHRKKHCRNRHRHGSELEHDRHHAAGEGHGRGSGPAHDHGHGHRQHRQHRHRHRHRDGHDDGRGRVHGPTDGHAATHADPPRHQHRRSGQPHERAEQRRGPRYHGAAEPEQASTRVHRRVRLSNGMANVPPAIAHGSAEAQNEYFREQRRVLRDKHTDEMLRLEAQRLYGHIVVHGTPGHV